MKAVIQRVSRARAEVGDKVVGQIADGLLVLLGITHGDTEADADKLVEKIIKLRIFEDMDGKMNESVSDIDGGILVVSQFTLYADCSKGTRPGFGDAARPEEAEPLYDYFVQKCIDTQLHVETGEFGEHMMLDFVNDGPVTILLES
ncbi:MAG: D-tyrosyl-tRNA(Tyr) deacylase [Candidatus Magasanikbacteria bacterium CG10_big_fil_rev_8_21_14_0_10_42_10]|uniref:D-aminoacyl-tRNA deacylase n=2 Tax=Candidatus Magasanikiibacteriota TaxID=1752731 RepID=A0A2H0TXW0_9BACT|nr:MAG: D-tyrosyl-tRNA(Tyr) deacylase [Candidatus Magasanikbacteria bacterium CG10_big_fil_rev_8_21_14_0_10_42_10]PIZ93477.1 MAG: D-tyrosyl-tRNA(Tyr) deacylase [Candidatus Magasanikbacteria bacterium CG_4_10_14_0_2_um_filter_41_10]